MNSPERVVGEEQPPAPRLSLWQLIDGSCLPLVCYRARRRSELVHPPVVTWSWDPCDAFLRSGAAPAKKT